MKRDKRFTIKTDKDRLVFRTTAFRADKGSVLHSGIYNKEFSSILSATAVSGIIYIFLALNYEMTVLHYLIVIFTFVIGFFGFRIFAFKERHMDVIFDKANNMVKITKPGFIKKDIEALPLDSVSSIEIESKKIVPENPDGIKFVEKISLQHGSVIPELGDEVEFITLLLKLTDGSKRLIYAEKIEGKIDGEPEIPLRDIRDFLEK